MKKNATIYKYLPVILILVYILLVGVGTIGDAFKWISGGEEGARKMFEFATNPLVGVILGILATAVVQSSSTVSSVIVGLVAGGVPVEVAIPMIMGANMGTTITNTIVSFGNISEGASFNRSFAAATVHDFFNLYSIIVFLPIEMAFHPLQAIAEYTSTWFVGGGDSKMGDINFIKSATEPIQDVIKAGCKMLPETVGAIFMIIIGIGLVISAVLYMGKTLKKVMNTSVKKSINKAFGKGAFMGVLYGTVLTILVQSSSTTTSLIVPLAGAGALTLRQIFPFTLGANIGTCITALLAATSISGVNEIFALQIAIVHLMYNVLGVILFLSIKFLKNLPINSAQWLANKSEQNRLWSFGYLFAVFFVLPGLVFLAQNLLGEDKKIQHTIEQQDDFNQHEKKNFMIE